MYTEGQNTKVAQSSRNNCCVIICLMLHAHRITQLYICHYVLIIRSTDKTTHNLL